MATTPKVTDEQAAEALRALATGTYVDDPETSPATTTEPPVEAAPAEEPAETPTEPEAAEVVQAGSDDIESLKKKLSEALAVTKKMTEEYGNRLRATSERFSQNQSILRERHLRKSSAADRALQILKKARTADGAAQHEVDQAITDLEGSMNPASPSYAEPAPLVEDKTITLNSFLNEKEMSGDEAEQFADYIRGPAAEEMSSAEQALAGRDLDGFLRLAHFRWQQSTEEDVQETTQADTVKAVQAVQRAQRQAARAGTAQPAAPRKATGVPAPVGIDFSKMNEAQQRAMVAKLLRQSTEEYH